jgi:hypothetical protein
MIGASVTKSKNIRRTGIPASKGGIPNPAYGPTVQRLAIAQGHVSIGDDKQGTRIYQFHDTPLDRLYSRLTRQAKNGSDMLRREYVALTKYRNHFIQAGKEATVASVDPNSIFASNPSSRNGMPMADFQMDHAAHWRQAQFHLGHKPAIVVDNVVCAETSLEVAGWSIGYISRTQARDKAEEVLRECGQKLATFWGIG